MAGVDISHGNSKDDEYMAVVIGMSESVEAALRDCGGDNIHMSMVRPRNIRRNIISALRIDKRDMLVFCIRRDARLVDDIYRTQRAKRRNVLKGKIHNYVDRKTFMNIRPIIVDYLAARRCSLPDVIFQCDADCIRFLKQNGLRNSYKGRAHVIADIVAWANSHGLAPDGVIEIDLAKSLRGEVLGSI